jgi:hypothetical protein
MRVANWGALQQASLTYGRRLRMRLLLLGLRAVIIALASEGATRQ